MPGLKVELSDLHGVSSAQNIPRLLFSHDDESRGIKKSVHFKTFNVSTISPVSSVAVWISFYKHLRFPWSSFYRLQVRAMENLRAVKNLNIQINQ